ncbi:MAG TPA: hypothetical protein VGC14_02125 [Rhizobium sp.]
MPWVRFIRSFNFAITPAVTIAYRAGMVEFVHRRCADKAVSGGRAEIVVRPGERTAPKGKHHGKA